MLGALRSDQAQALYGATLGTAETAGWVWGEVARKGPSIGLPKTDQHFQSPPPTAALLDMRQFHLQQSRVVSTLSPDSRLTSLFRKASRSTLASFPMRLVVRIGSLESTIVGLARSRPRSRVFQGLCSMIQREAMRSNNRYRTIQKPRMIVDICDVYRGVYFSGKEYEPETTNLVLNLVRPGDVVFDVGANLGYYSFLTSEVIGPSGCVHAFEPNPGLAAVVRKSLKICSCPESIVFNQLAVADGTQKRLEFYLSQDPLNSGLSTLSPQEEQIRNGIFSRDVKTVVEVITLDEYAKERGIKKCDLIKIDVEGGEAKVIKGMPHLLRELRPKFVICEGWLNGEADALMRSFNYIPHVVSEKGIERPAPGAKFWGNLFFVSTEALSTLDVTGMARRRAA